MGRKCVENFTFSEIHCTSFFSVLALQKACYQILLKLTQTGGVLSAKSFGILLLKQSDRCAGGLSVFVLIVSTSKCFSSCSHFAIKKASCFYVESTFYIVEEQTRYGKISCGKMWGGNLIDPFTERWPHHRCHY